MPQIVVLPHVELCPEGAVIEAVPGKSICDNLLDNGIEIEHACEKSCACTTCHVLVREGFNALVPSEEDEDDLRRTVAAMFTTLCCSSEEEREGERGVGCCGLV